MASSMLATNFAEPPVPVLDRRRSHRHRALMSARIVFRGGYCSIGCLILDISEGGALLQPNDVVMCPKTFQLKPRFDPPRQAEIVWRKGDKIGVRFL
jgi:hypothetical protein